MRSLLFGLAVCCLSTVVIGGQGVVDGSDSSRGRESGAEQRPAETGENGRVSPAVLANVKVEGLDRSVGELPAAESVHEVTALPSEPASALGASNLEADRFPGSRQVSVAEQPAESDRAGAVVGVGELPVTAASIDIYQGMLPGLRLSLGLSTRPVMARDLPGSEVTQVGAGGGNEGLGLWVVEPSDITLSQVLTRWTQLIGWQLIWDAERDFMIDARVELKTSFKNALEILMLSLAQSEYPLQARVSKEARIVRIGRYMDARSR